MIETVFNTKYVDMKNQYMFLGEKPNISRYDIQKYPIFQKLVEKQLSFFWRPEEVDLTKDSRDFKMLNDAQRHIFTKNISSQIVNDTVQARSPGIALLPIIALPELEACVEIWQAMEMIHNQSYSYLLRNIYPNCSEVFDNIILDDEIINRSELVTKYYDIFIDKLVDYRYLQKKNWFTDEMMLDLKKSLLLCVASINILEGLSFYVSFACSFAFAEQGLMEGNAKIISLIARDEALHLAITQNIIKKWNTGEDDPVMVKLYQECLGEIEQMYYEAIAMEKQWAKYLFKDGSMIGLSENILNQYVEYIAGKRMKNLGIKHNFSNKNPLSWTDKYLKSSDLQVAPMETELVSYIVGSVKNDIADDTFKDMNF